MSNTGFGVDEGQLLQQGDPRFALPGQLNTAPPPEPAQPMTPERAAQIMPIVPVEGAEDVHVGPAQTDVWMYEAGPSAQASWPTARPSPEPAPLAAQQAAQSAAASPANTDPAFAPGPQAPAVPGAAQRPGGVGYGYRLPPIEPQYYPPDYADRVNEQHAKLREQLENDYFFNEMSPEELDDKLKDLDAERDAALQKYAAYANSFEGQQVQFARDQFDLQNQQLNRQAEQGDVDARRFQMETLQRRDALKQSNAKAKEFAQRRAEMEQRVDAQMASYGQAIKELQSSKIDPDRWWKSKGTGGQVAAMLAMALGTAGAIMTKRPNEVAAMIEKRIDNDIAAQVADLNNKANAAKMSGSLVGMMRQRLGDVDAAEAASKAHIYAQLEQRLALTATDAQRQKVKLAAAGLRDEFGKRRQLAEDQLRLQAIAQAKQLEQQRMAAMAYAAQQRALAEQQAQMNAALGLPEGAMEIDASDLPKGGKYIHGVGYVLNGQLADEATKKLQAIKEARTLISGVLGPNSKFNFKDRAQVGALVRQIQIKVNKAGGLGAMDNGTQVILDDITGDPNAIISLDDPQAKMRQLDRQFGVEEGNTVGSLAPIPGTMKMVPDQDKKGKVRMKQRFYMTGQIPTYNPSAVPVK